MSGAVNLDADEQLAVEFALGILDSSERESVHLRLTNDRKFAKKVSTWEVALAPMAESLPPTAPPPGILDGVLKTIHEKGYSIPGTMTVRSRDGNWREVARGVEVRILWRNLRLNRQSLLLRMAPGAVYEQHHHWGAEECLVLEGDVSFNDFTLEKGDFHLASAGAEHPAATSRGGCLLYLNTNL